MSDGTLTDTGLVTVDISCVNDAPVAASQTVTTDEDTATPITLGASDADGDSLTYAIGTGPAHGSLSGTAPALTYTPAPNYHGPDSFTFTASDGLATSNVATVSITVTSVNDTPTLTNPGPQSSAEGSSPSLQIVAADVDGDTLTYAASGLPTGLSISPTTGLISGDLDFASAGSYPVTVTVTDGIIASPVEASFTWTVGGTNRAPVAASQTVTTDEDTATPITLGASDADGDSLTYAIGTGPAHGSLSGTAPALTYTPAPNYHGPDSFTFTASDGLATSNVATVSITVTSVNDTPTCLDGDRVTRRGHPPRQSRHLPRCRWRPADRDARHRRQPRDPEPRSGRLVQLYPGSELPRA